MATITTDPSIANEEMNPITNKVNDVLFALHELYSHRVMYIKGYETGKFELMYFDFYRGHIIECEKILYQFMKNYPNYSF